MLQTLYYTFKIGIQITIGLKIFMPESGVREK